MPLHCSGGRLDVVIIFSIGVGVNTVRWEHWSQSNANFNIAGALGFPIFIMIITIDDVVVVTNVIDVDAVVIAAAVLALAVEGVVVTVIYRLILLLFFTISNIIISIRVIVVVGIDVDAYALVEEAIIITVIVAGVNCFGRSIVIVITVTGAGAGCSFSCSRSSIRGRNRNTAIIATNDHRFQWQMLIYILGGIGCDQGRTVLG